MKYSLIIIFFACITLIFQGMLYFHSKNSDNKILTWVHDDNNFRGRKDTLPVLLYHNIDGPGDYSISLDRLRRHFELIAERNIRVVPLSVLSDYRGSPDEKLIAITFDDGYFSMYTRLMDLAHEFDYPVTLFVYTDFIRDKAQRSLSWKHLREMQTRGIDIQSHSMSHADLRLLSAESSPENMAALFRELYLSKRIIGIYMGRELCYFAFPYGRYNAMLLDMCENAGYERVFSTDAGENVISWDNYCIKRHHIKSSCGINEFLAIIDSHPKRNFY